MSGNRVTLDWQISETATFDAPTPIPAQTPRNSSRLLPYFVAAILLLLVAVGAFGYSLVRRAERSLADAQAQVQSALDAEAWIAQNRVDLQAEKRRAAAEWRARQTPIWMPFSKSGAPDIRPRAATGPAQAATQYTVLDMEWNGDVVFVRLLAKPNAGAPYYAVRVYRETESGLQPVPPDPVFWGEQQALETNYFRLEYYDRDRAEVEAVAARLDALYADLRREAGLALAPVDERTQDRLTVEISLAVDQRMLDNLPHLAFSHNRLIAPSPLLLQVPEGGSRVNALAATTLFEMLESEGKPDGEAVHLAELVRAMGEHATWETLIPAVYGGSPLGPEGSPADEFEASWQRYVAQQYGN